MSSHHSQRAIQLHHKQVNDGLARRMSLQAERYCNYILKSRELRLKYNILLVIGFGVFVYIMLLCTVYMAYQFIWA